MAAFIDNFKRYCGAESLAWLIAVNVGIWAFTGIASLICDATGTSSAWTHSTLALSSEPAVALRHPWTAATYMVTQYSLMHMLFNMLWLFWFGRLALTLLTSRQLLWLYIGGGLSGAAAYILASLPGNAAAGSYLVGSSAAVMAVMTAAAFLTPDLRLNLILIGEVKLKWLALVCVALTFFGAGTGTTSGNAAHLGGILFGMIYAFARKGMFKGYLGTRARPARRKAPRNIRRNGRAVARAARSLSDEGRLDQLLDKIRVSGYTSLTEGERNELTILSQRLNKK